MQPTEERRKNYADDHDLLIALHEQVKGLRDDIRDLKDNNKTRTDDHEPPCASSKNTYGLHSEFSPLLNLLVFLTF